MGPGSLSVDLPAADPICCPLAFKKETPGKPSVVHGLDDVFFNVIWYAREPAAPSGEPTEMLRSATVHVFTDGVVVDGTVVVDRTVVDGADGTVVLGVLVVGVVVDGVTL